MSLGSGDERLVGHVAKRLGKTEALRRNAARKRAQAAAKQLPGFSFGGKRMCKRLYDATEGRMIERMVVPRVGSKSLIVDGRRRI